MVTLRWIILEACFVAALAALGCGDSGGNSGGFGGTTGTGGMGATPDAGVSCTESGCDDGNACTIDGLCESVTGECIGSGSEPLDTPCGQNDIFVCDGAGVCVGCNVDAQCDGFFPDNECREDPKCVGAACALPDALPDGTPCSSGECRAGVCSSPWAPKQQLVPMACGGSICAGLFEICAGLFDSTMDMTVAPTPIMPAEQFSASLETSMAIPRELLQDVLIAAFPASLFSIEVSRARAEIVSTRVVSGSPVNTTLAPLPQTFPIQQAGNPGDPGSQACATHDDCPLGDFGQVCSLAGRCNCACRPGCVPRRCANVVTAPLVFGLETIQGAIYSSFPSGEVCFDVGGDASDPDIDRSVRTGIRLTADPLPLAIDCEGGTVNDNGTPDDAQDDFVDPNPLEDQICFPIGSSE